MKDNLIQEILITEFKVSNKKIEMNLKKIITSQEPIIKVDTNHPPMNELPIIDKDNILIYKPEEL